MKTVVADVIAIIEEGRRKVYRAVNTSMVAAHWRAGKRIVDAASKGRDWADYGFSETARCGFEKCYSTFPNEEILYTVCTKLSWSHNRLGHALRD